MDTKLVINDLKNDVSHLPPVIVATNLFETYETTVIDNVEYAIGRKHKNTAMPAEIETIDHVTNFSRILGDRPQKSGYYIEKVEKPVALLKLLNLVKEPLPLSFGKGDDLGGNLIGNISTSNILNWCDRFGISLGLESESLWTEHRLIGFPIGKFRYNLGFLFETFKLWQALWHENHKEIKQYKAVAGWIEEYKSTAKEIAKMKGMLAFYVSHRKGAEPMITMLYDSQRNAYQLQFETHDYFSLAYFQLAVLMTKGEKNISICKNQACGNYFSGHGNKKYCDQCDRRTIWSRKKKSTQA